ncbi:MAG: hypothetical protein KME35_07100 [Aphanocapsa sp. GSE-SYN-MK-11-07L]|jgi:hypothetical protein|nr:hypothetical protein [Aphanocapsa sp. GSE-SYN-MK-11-07L]
MRQEFVDRFNALLSEKRQGLWKDGWVYGRLKQEFDLQPDELDAMATGLGFKYKWNPMLKEILEQQWQKEEPRWLEQKLNQLQAEVSAKRQAASIDRKIATLLAELETSGGLRQQLTDVERALISLILKMSEDEQIWLLEIIFNRYKQ